MIRYKVVRIASRSPFVGHSCYASGSYQLTYEENTILTAKEGTLGIAVFGRKYQAEHFLRADFSRNHYKIIRVSSIGRGKRYRFVCESQDTVNLDIFYRRHRGNFSDLLEIYPYTIAVMKSPIGTIFYQQVKVLE